MVRLFATAVLLLAAAPAWADFEAGAAAYKSGDYATALAEWTAAAKDGEAKAQFGLGSLYRNGQGVAIDVDQAVAWYRKAAEQGLAEAQFNMGVLYQKGAGVELDHRQAAKWYERAAEQHSATAQFNLGMIYMLGLGIDPDKVSAHMWFTLASGQGNKRARRAADDLARNMSPDEAQEARRRALAWIQLRREI